MRNFTAWQTQRSPEPLGPITNSHVDARDCDTFAFYSCLPCRPDINTNPNPIHQIVISLSLSTPSVPLPQRSLKSSPSFGMYPIYHFATALLLLLLVAKPSFGALVEEQPLVLKYHNGALLKGNITVNLIWYGRFTPIQRSIIVDFIHSLALRRSPLPSASSWWKTTEKYRGGATNLLVGRQILHEAYSLGKSLRNRHLVALAGKVNALNAINVVLTASDVAVDGFCSRCGTHGSNRDKKTAYVWVGNSVVQCPGQCAWPFHQPIYGPQTPPLVAPNGDVGVDGMIINLATLLAGAVTNPYNNGYFQGPSSAPLEAVSACTGVFGTGAYPGYPGRVLVDKATGASYNAVGVNGRRFLLPAMWDPQTSACKPLL